MRFAALYNLHLIWLILALGVFLFWALQKHRQAVNKFIEEPLTKRVALGYAPSRHKMKALLILGVFIFSMLALLRPQWGFEWQEVKRKGLDILIMVDTSKSMLTQDVKPNRLERTKLAVKDLIRKLNGDRVGLIAFAGDAFLMCPLTVDYNGFILSLDDLDTDSISRGGTNISRAIEESLNSYKDVSSKYKAVIIITDGDNLEGDPVKWAKKAKAEGVKIYTIGIGTKEGELIQLRDEEGHQEFLKDQNGNFIKSRLNEQLL
ncbi:MAG: VWA domain-containing protein, partial [Candidatus Omnitrophica bacterium]|nr:VWA domain-containing protein [Candidatus Omnitrophota bacterium]